MKFKGKKGVDFQAMNSSEIYFCWLKVLPGSTSMIFVNFQSLYCFDYISTNFSFLRNLVALRQKFEYSRLFMFLFSLMTSINLSSNNQPEGLEESEPANEISWIFFLSFCFIEA